ncbi:hypothetical protein EDB81DRAFT_797948 [Dactylonectria macrodidyma]|uniref:Biotin-protein ligase N-terminal domain-containing protein n=1 Tax=Dactylonectria macrodidyma TaxID=307937 RepID=A0A9P9J4X8_9HYPO|nr:hypothetical protein EDB81DRAFT_797948 [Dactylonectria macrodidyma]
MRNTLLATMVTVAGAIAPTDSSSKALVYRGPAACPGCPEAIAKLLKSSPWEFHVTYAGPDEDVDVDENSLKGVQVYAQAGGPDLDDAWKRVKKYNGSLHDFVSSGGHYMGFCLGAYLAGNSPGFGLLPRGADAIDERSQHGAQVSSEKDTVIQVDWTFSSGSTEKNRWVYFQDGAAITGLNKTFKSEGHGRVIATYSKNGDVAASVTPYGKGWVGLVGPHPEATSDWYSEYGIKNPDGIKFDMGYDFITATLNGGQFNVSQSATTSTRQAGDTPMSTAAAVGRGHLNPLAWLY